MLGIKQDALADALGEDWTQKKVSLLESKEVIEPGTLDLVANVLKVPAKAIENFDEEAAIMYINTFHDNSSNGTFHNNNGTLHAFNYQFNLVEKWLEALDENKRLFEELLKSERDKVAMLGKMLEGK